MNFGISKTELTQILSQAQAVDNELFRETGPHDAEGMARKEVLRRWSLGTDSRKAFEATLYHLDDRTLAEAVAISLAGDGSYAPGEIEELANDLMSSTDRAEKLKMLTDTPQIGMMFYSGMRILGLS